MILVTVGTQLPFDRLMDYLDDWCSTQVNLPELVVQIGDSNFESKYFTCLKEIQPKDFASIVSRCDLILSHAGMGSILTALKYSKPVIIVPRSAKLGEHRNDHQFHTAKSFKSTPGVYVAENKEELMNMLSKQKELKAGTLEPSIEYDNLVSYIQNEINFLGEVLP